MTILIQSSLVLKLSIKTLNRLKDKTAKGIFVIENSLEQITVWMDVYTFWSPVRDGPAQAMPHTLQLARKYKLLLPS